MAKGYWIVHVEVDDPGAYAAYRAFIEPYLVANKGRFVVRGGQQSVPEGSALPRTVVVEFPSFADARRAYDAAEYQEGRTLRTAVSRSDFLIVEGVDP